MGGEKQTIKVFNLSQLELQASIHPVKHEICLNFESLDLRRLGCNDLGTLLL